MGLLALIIIGGVLTGLAIFHWGKWTQDSHSEGFAFKLLSAGLYLLIISVIVAGNFYCFSIKDNLRMEAFHSYNQVNYQVTVDRMTSYLSTEKYVDVLISGSVEKFQLTNPIYESIKDWRDEVNDYNNTLRHWRFWARHPLTSLFVHGPSPYLKHLVIQ